MKELHELRERLCDELKEYGKKGITTGTLDVVDKMAHTIKNLDKIIEAEDGYSGRYDMGRGSYRDSYARGRDGRYSRSGLSDKLRDLMDDAPDERTRLEIKRLIEKME